MGIKVGELYEDLKDTLCLEIIAGSNGKDRIIENIDINRPGLALAGYFEFFGYKRVQVLGKGEVSYLFSLSKESCKEILDKLFSYEIPCFFVSWHQELPKDFLTMANNFKVTVFSTPLPTGRLSTLLNLYLEEKLAIEISYHGSLLEVYGVGILLKGPSGIGKSECALELVERGHILIADDVVRIKQLGNRLVGYGVEPVKFYSEIRGVGIINIKNLFGLRAITDKKEIELIINLEEWDKSKVYDRLGIEEKKEKILDVYLPALTIPIRPGRNIAVITEVAAVNHRLCRGGYTKAGEELEKKVAENLEKLKTTPF
jgi:HPr kinase/phosphorylase